MVAKVAPVGAAVRLSSSMSARLTKAYEGFTDHVNVEDLHSESVVVFVDDADSLVID